MLRTLFLSILPLAFATVACAQGPATLVEGVEVVRLDDGRNVAWVEFSDHVTLVLPADADAELAASVADMAPRPARFVVRTGRGGPSIAGTGMIELVVRGSVGANGGQLAFERSMTLTDGTRSLDVIEIDPDYGLVATVPDAGVVFGGDVIGDVDPASRPRLDTWVRALHRLDRIAGDRIVPSRGRDWSPDDVSALHRALDALGQQFDQDAAGASPPEVVASARSTAFLPPPLVEALYRERVGLTPPWALIDGAGLREGPSPTRETPGWTRPAKVVMLNFWGERAREFQLVAPGVEIVMVDGLGAMAAVAGDADAIIGFINAPAYQAAGRLRWVQTFSAGVEGVLAIPGFVQSDVTLTNAQRIASTAIAEHAMGMVMALSRRLQLAALQQANRSWNRGAIARAFPSAGAAESSSFSELRGKTLLVVGLGGIGTEIARIGHGLGMRVMATRNSSREGPSFVEYVGLSDELDDLLGDADVVANALPLTVDTRGTFDRRRFGLMKPNALFVNVGRGGTVDQDALVAALEAGDIAGAGLDVTSPEPLPSTSPLWAMPNVLITPHYAGDSDEGDERLFLLVRENLRRFVNGEPLLSVVDKERGY